MPPPKVKKSPPPPASGKKKLSGKTRRVEDWSSEGEGQRIILVADSGMGKTTLASMLPKPVFIGCDEGGRMIKNPRTGENLKRITGVEDYYDVKEVMRDYSLFDGYETVIVDTVTMVDTWMSPWVVENVKTEKGASVKNIVAYGFNKGYQHIYDTFTGFLTDCDALVRAGKTVALLGQSAPAKVATSGEDYLRDEIRLQHQNKFSNVYQANEWADHVLRIHYIDITVDQKKAKGTTERAIFFKPEPHYFAKSRTLPLDIECVTFENPEDDSIWRMLFPENY